MTMMAEKAGCRVAGSQAAAVVPDRKLLYSESSQVRRARRKSRRRHRIREQYDEKACLDEANTQSGGTRQKVTGKSD